jgi:hypothetical protein
MCLGILFLVATGQIPESDCAFAFEGYPVRRVSEWMLENARSRDPIGSQLPITHTHTTHIIIGHIACRAFSALRGGSGGGGCIDGILADFVAGEAALAGGVGALVVAFGLATTAARTGDLGAHAHCGGCSRSIEGGMLQGGGGLQRGCRGFDGRGRGMH